MFCQLKGFGHQNTAAGAPDVWGGRQGHTLSHGAHVFKISQLTMTPGVAREHRGFAFDFLCGSSWLPAWGQGTAVLGTWGLGAGGQPGPGAPHASP